MAPSLTPTLTPTPGEDAAAAAAAAAATFLQLEGTELHWVDTVDALQRAGEALREEVSPNPNPNPNPNPGSP